MPQKHTKNRMLTKQKGYITDSP